MAYFNQHNVISHCKCNGIMASTVCTVAQRVVKCAGMLFRVCVRVPSYETDDRDREYTV